MGWWQKYLAWRNRSVESIAFDDQGFSHRLRRATASFKWLDISEIYAYKRDLLTVDCVCLGLQSGEYLIEITEDAVGYQSFEAEVEHRFDIAPDWKLEVYSPPFAQQFKRLYPVELP